MRVKKEDIEFLVAQQEAVTTKANTVLAELGKQANEHASKATLLFAMARDLAMAIQANKRALEIISENQPAPDGSASSLP